MPIDIINADRLEPGIPTFNGGTSNDALVLMAYSQAISLKRIADSLAGHMDSRPGDDNDPYWLRTMAAGLDANGQTGDADRLRLAAAEIVRVRGLVRAAVDSAQAADIVNPFERQGPSAEKTDDNPWIDWPGGACPVPNGTRLDIRYRNGVERKATAGDNEWGSGASGPFWRHDNSAVDIVAYRRSAK